MRKERFTKYQIIAVLKSVEASRSREILQLRKALNEARLERDILKKATVDSICQCNTPFNYLFRCFELQCLSRSVV